MGLCGGGGSGGPRPDDGVGRGPYLQAAGSLRVIPSTGAGDPEKECGVMVFGVVNSLMRLEGSKDGRV